jgi:hypothetical protein
MAIVDITMSVDGGDHLNDIDLRRLKELWEHYAASLPPSQVYGFDAFKDRVQSSLDDHIRRNKVWFGCRPIHVKTAMSHRLDQYNRHIVILPQRATWDAVNRGYDYLHAAHPETTMSQEWDSMIRHWAGDNLAKYLDIQGGFSRLATDRQDLFNLILVLDKARRYTYASEEVIGSAFDFETRGNLEKQREDSLFFLVHRCKPLPM